jgi:CRISPR-associated protein Cas6
VIYWEEEDQGEGPATLGVIDLVFPMRGREMAIDHAMDMRSALVAVMPLLDEIKEIGIHQIQAAASGNGWYSPLDAGDQTFLLSRRAKLVLRVPSDQIEKITTELTDATLQVGAHELALGVPAARELLPTATLFARYVVMEEGEEEAAFLERVIGDLRELGVRCKKVVCGKAHVVTLPVGERTTLSLMLTDLAADESAALQLYGVGEWQQYGCGLFIPHKDVKK